MPADSPIITHYDRDRPMDRIRDQLVAAGFNMNALQADDLAGVDEFHLGGRLATVELLASLQLSENSRVLDVGCGIGGAARTVASTAGCHVTGVDLTPVFVETARELSDLVGLAAQTTFEVGNALALPFDDQSFDAVTVLHVGMNIGDKVALFTELQRVLADGATLHVYDIMRVGDGEITYPVPWSTDSSTSFLETPDHYAEAISAAGLTAAEPVNRIALVREAMAHAQANPPAVNLSYLMGADWPQMFSNLSACLADGVLAPHEIVATRS